MPQRLCKVCDGWHDLNEPWPHNCCSEAPARSSLPAPQVIADTMAPTQSMVDGKFYTSKAALRATYKPSGNKDGKRYNEVGNEKPKPFQKPRPKREEIRAAVRRAASRVGLGA